MIIFASMIEIKCAYCGKTFQANRRDHKTCSQACRVALHYALKFVPQGENRKDNIYFFDIDKGVVAQVLRTDERLSYADMLEDMCIRFPDLAQYIRTHNPCKTECVARKDAHELDVATGKFKKQINELALAKQKFAKRRKDWSKKRKVL